MKEIVIVKGIDTVKYRYSEDFKIIQWWSDHKVPGLAKAGWNTTKSENVRLLVRNRVKQSTAK